MDKIGWRPTNEDDNILYIIASVDWKDLIPKAKEYNILAKIGKPAVEPLIAMLKDMDRNARDGAAKTLGQIGDKRAVEPLISVLKDEEWSVRSAAARALGEIKDARAVEPLISALRDKHEMVRDWAAIALEKITGKKVSW